MALQNKLTGQTAKEQLTQQSSSEVQELKETVQAQMQTIEQLEMQLQLANEQIENLSNSDKELKKAQELNKKSEQIKRKVDAEREDYISKIKKREEYLKYREEKAEQKEKELENKVKDEVDMQCRRYRYKWKSHVIWLALYCVYITILSISQHKQVFTDLKGIWSYWLANTTEWINTGNMLENVLRVALAVFLCILVIAVIIAVFQAARTKWTIDIVYPLYIVPYGLLITFYEKLTSILPLSACLMAHTIIIATAILIYAIRHR